MSEKQRMFERALEEALWPFTILGPSARYYGSVEVEAYLGSPAFTTASKIWNVAAQPGRWTSGP